MARFRSQVREYPGRWIGFHLKWLGDGSANRRFNEYLKTLPMRVFDMQSKTWWVPSDYAVLALATARDLGLLNDAEFAEGGRVCGAGINATVGFNASSLMPEGVRPEDVAIAFTRLGLMAFTPWWLIQKVYTEWKIRLHDVGAAVNEIDALDAAYNLLKAWAENAANAQIATAKAEGPLAPDEDIPF